MVHLIWAEWVDTKKSPRFKTFKRFKVKTSKYNLSCSNVRGIFKIFFYLTFKIARIYESKFEAFVSLP